MFSRYHIDTNQLNFPKKDMEVSNYMKDGMIADWDTFEQVLDYSYKKIIQSESELHPVLFSEAPWNKKDRREQVGRKMMDIDLGIHHFFKGTSSLFSLVVSPNQ